MKGLSQKSAITISIGIPMALYLIGLNPWFTPDQHDDVLYFFGARSIGENGTFAFNGIPITDWPPVLPLILAPWLGLFGDSIYVAKLAVIAMACGGLWMVFTYFKARGEPSPGSVTLLTGILPVSLICGAGILSEWPFIFLSFAFLMSLESLRKNRGWGWVVAAGALLATAALTRFVGVFLGAAVLAQAFGNFRAKKRFSSIVPEATVGLMGAIPWLIWKFRCVTLIRSGEAPSGAYDRTDHYLERFSNFDIPEFLSKIEATLFSFGKAARGVIGSPVLAWLAVGFCFLLVCGGLIIRLRKHGISPAEWYVFVTLALMLVDLKKPERYFLPVAPFLVGYALLAVYSVSTLRHLQWTRVLPSVFLIGWVGWLLVLDGQLLFRGNMSGNRGGFSQLASPTIESFYRGDSFDMLLAIRYADEHASEGEPIGTSGFHGKYVYAFTGRDFIYLDGEDPRAVRWFLLRGDEMPSSEFVGDNPNKVAEFGAYRVYSSGGRTEQ